LPEEKDFIEKVFGCQALSRYATHESGVLAQQCKQGLFHINTSGYHVEILAIDKDQPVKPGETGRVVVTDLFSHSLPLIRYDTGDLAVLAERCNCQLQTPVLKNIGRIVERIFDTQGNPIHHQVIRITVKNVEDIFNSIIQYQLIQKDRSRYLIKLVLLAPVPDENIIRELLWETLGPDAEIEIEYTDSIPPLKSGKRPFIINEYSGNNKTHHF